MEEANLQKKFQKQLLCGSSCGKRVTLALQCQGEAGQWAGWGPLSREEATSPVSGPRSAPPPFIPPQPPHPAPSQPSPPGAPSFQLPHKEAQAPCFSEVQGHPSHTRTGHLPETPCLGYRG